MVTPFILDCDTGRDDALAIWYALLNDLPLKAVVASYGNTPRANVVANCRNVLAAFADKNIPVFEGAAAALRAHSYTDKIVTPRQEASGNGLCNIQLPYDGQTVDFAVEDDFAALWAFIQAATEQHGSKIDYIITGPATNFARLIEIYGADAVKAHIGKVVMMGGKFDALWARLPFADFNIGADPFAVKAIMEAGMQINFVPMNSTWPIAVALDVIEGFAPKTALAQQVQDIMIAHCRAFSPEPIFRFHDPAVMLVVEDDCAFTVRHLDIITDDRADDFGRLVAQDNAGYLCGVFQISDAQIIDFEKRLLAILGLS